MAITFNALMDGLSRNPWTGELLAPVSPDFSTLFALTCGDYQKWLRKQIRQNGRRAVVGNAQHSPVDVFVKERTGFSFLLLASDEIEVTVGNDTYYFMSAACLGYYLFDDDGEMIVTAGKALDVATWQDASTLIVG